MVNRVQKHGEVIASQQRQTIAQRYKRITSAINREFWNSNSDELHTFYVGSYGRGTAVSTSDIDMLATLPPQEFWHFNNLSGNGQSRLLQAVRVAILSTYPQSQVKADGQVVMILFADGIKFEVLPSFENQDWSGNIKYTYPDTNMGGNWLSTNPKAEQAAMRQKNASSNGLLFDTCRHIRFIRDNYFSSYNLSGIVIDSFVYSAIGNWKWLNPGESSTSAPGTYEQRLYDAFSSIGYSITAPGSHDTVDLGNSKDCLRKVLNYMR